MYQRKLVLTSRHLTTPAHRRRSLGESSDFNTLWEPLRKLESKDILNANIFRPSTIRSHPNIIAEGPVRMLISASPTDDSLSEYIEILRRHNVKHVVRLCEPFYNVQTLRNAGFQVHDWPFQDGEVPPAIVISNWLNLLDKEFDLHQYAIANASAPEPDFDDFLSNIDNSSDEENLQKPVNTIAIHCASGIGRAPLLAAVALLECGMNSFEAIALVRGVRIGSINLRQMSFLETYMRRPLVSRTKGGKLRARSGSFGSFWTSVKGARKSRTRSPYNAGIISDPETSVENFFLPRSVKLRPTRLL